MLELFLGWVSLSYTERSRIDPKLVELCRIRLAARNEWCTEASRAAHR